MRLRFDGILLTCSVVNFLPSLTLKYFFKSANIWQEHGQEYGGLDFFDSQCRNHSRIYTQTTQEQETVFRVVHQVPGCVGNDSKSLHCGGGTNEAAGQEVLAIYDTHNG